MAEYDDDTYMALLDQLRTILGRLLDMEGNDEDLIRTEIDNILEDQ